MAERHAEGFFPAKDELRLFWESALPEVTKAHVVLVHGYFDHSGRFAPVRDALVGRGFGVHAFDYRGHGQSGGRKGHCDHFSQYVDDLASYWARVRKEVGSAQKVFLLAHSHGALIAIHWLAQGQNDVAGAVLSAPYLKLAFEPPPLKRVAALAVGKFVPWLPVRHELEPSQLTRDPQAQQKVASDRLYGRTTTPRWFTESSRAQEEAMTLASKIHLPAFVFCGSNDQVADPSTTKVFFERLQSEDKVFKLYPDRVHESLNDIGKEEVWNDVLNWMEKHG